MLPDPTSFLSRRLIFTDMQKLKADEQSIAQMKLAYEKQLQSERTLKTQVKYGKRRGSRHLHYHLNQLHRQIN